MNGWDRWPLSMISDMANFPQTALIADTNAPDSANDKAVEFDDTCFADVCAPFSIILRYLYAPEFEFSFKQDGNKPSKPKGKVALTCYVTENLQPFWFCQ